MKLEKNIHYHIYNRAVSKRLIFRYDRDYRLFMFKLSDFASKYKIEIFVYCVMPNHFHILLRSDHKAENISKFMQVLQYSYARYFNRTRDHSGHVFESRFCPKEIKSNQEFQRVKVYILNNPVKAGLVEKRYKWPYLWLNPIHL
ncbi:transposase [Patescibacteria group bacterium]